MKTVKTIDEHPGKWNDNIELFLVEAKYTEMGGGEFITGFRVDPTHGQGMFDEVCEPVQGLKLDGCEEGFARFTMYMHTTLTLEQIELLKKNKELHIKNEWDGIILNELFLKVVE